MSVSDSLPPPTTLLRRRVGIAALFALNGMVVGIWASRIPQITEIHGLSEARLALLLLLIAGGAILFFGQAGRAADRFGADRVAMALASGAVLALSAVALAPNQVLLALALSAMGATLGGMDVAMNAWAAQVDAKARRDLMPVFHALFSLGAGAGAATGAVTLGLGWDVFAHFAGLGTLSLAFALALSLGTGGAARAAPRAVPLSERFAPPPRALIGLGIIAAFAALGEGAMIDWSALFLVERLGTGQDQAALGLTVFSAAMVGTRLAGPWLLARFGAQRAAEVSGLVAAVGVALALFSSGLWGVLAGYAVMGLGYGLVFPLAMSAATRHPDLPPGRAIAAVATLGYTGILVGPVLIGFLAHALSLPTAFGVLLGLALLTTLIARRAWFGPGPR